MLMQIGRKTLKLNSEMTLSYFEVSLSNQTELEVGKSKVNVKLIRYFFNIKTSLLSEPEDEDPVVDVERQLMTKSKFLSHSRFQGDHGDAKVPAKRKQELKFVSSKEKNCCKNNLKKKCKQKWLQRNQGCKIWIFRLNVQKDLQTIYCRFDEKIETKL